MKIFPPELEIGDYEGFTPEKDIFKRADLGAGLTNLMSNVSHPIVLALDGQWGSGKTTFLRMWAGELRKNNYPVVYFDAFENDYTGDAFSAIVGKIVGLLQEKKIEKRSKSKAFTDTAVAVGKVLGRSTAKVIVQAAALGVVDAAGIESVGKTIASEASGLTDRHIGELITGQLKNKEAIVAFRDALSALPQILAEPQEEGVQRPLIFIIDELDRCKPGFALELLERIKHFFNVPNVHFVLGVHIGQLQNSVKVAYGSEIDAGLYLQKFMHLTYQLVDENRHENERNIRKYAEYLLRVLEFKQEDLGCMQAAVTMICIVGELRGFSLRTVERIMTTMAVTMAATNENTIRIPALLTGLSILKVLHPELYHKAKQGDLEFSDVKTALRMDDWNKPEHSKERFFYNWWLVATDENAPEELKEKLGNGLFRYSVMSLTELVQVHANLVVDRLRMSN